MPNSTIWRRTFAGLRDQFQHAADRFPSVRYVVLQALDLPGAVPQRFQRFFQEVGGHDVGEIKPAWEPIPHALPSEANDEFAQMVTERLWLDCPAILGYLAGPKKGRARFAALAQQAWIALPGTHAGKAEAFPQLNVWDRWCKLVHDKLRFNSGSYFDADERLLVEYQDTTGQLCEAEFEPERVEKGRFVSVGYPQAENLPPGARRWLVTELATDPFTASLVAIDTLLADPNPHGTSLISWQQMDAYLKSPAYQNANHLLDFIHLGGGHWFPIYRYDCRPLEGTVPSLCPNADPPRDEKDRDALLYVLPKIEQLLRAKRLIKEGQTIHWVGRQSTPGTSCRCSQTQGVERRDADSSHSSSTEKGGRPRAGAATSNSWSSVTVLAKTKELCRRLRLWHIEDNESPLPFVSPTESREWVQLTFRGILGRAGVHPSPNPTYLSIVVDSDDTDVTAAISHPVPEADRALTFWLLADFKRHLETACSMPALAGLAEAFGRLLDATPYAIREPEGVWERSMAAYWRDEAGDLRCNLVTGAQIPAELLDTVMDASVKLHDAAPVDWAVTASGPNPDEPAVTRASESIRRVQDHCDLQEDGRTFRELITWLKRVTSDWPPEGIDWPLVLSQADHLWSGLPQPETVEASRPIPGQAIAEFLRQCIDPDTFKDSDPFSRGYAYAGFLLQGFQQLKAYCTACLFLGYDLDAIERPVRQLPPFHALMCLGCTMVELIRCLRDLSKPDIEQVAEPAPRPVQVGAAFGRNTHQAIWKLADEICTVGASVTEGRLDAWKWKDQEPGATEHAWAKLCEAMDARLPSCLETKETLVLLEAESRRAFARVYASTASPPTTTEGLPRVRSGNARMDAHINGLIEGLLLSHPTAHAELPSLTPLLETLASYLGACAQGAAFKGSVDMAENKFQAHVALFMRMRLGTEVTEHCHQAGGITDIRYNGAIVELKVEKADGERAHIAEKYGSQPTQYAGSEARQIAVVLVLDLTEKDGPPGDIRNDIFVADVPTHGGPDSAKKYPSKAIFFVLNGNTRDPSSYS